MTEDTTGDDTGLPLYLQVASTLRTAILRGVYPVGSRLPTEEELCQRFDVSRHTIREALRQLRADDLIASRPGSRPIVAPSPARPAERLGIEMGEDFFDYTIGTRLEIETMDMVAMTRDLARETDLPAGEQWLRVTGFRIEVDTDRATCWNTYYFGARYAKVGRLLRRHVGPVLPVLEDLFGKRISRLTRSAGAVAMPPAQAERFGVEPGSPALGIVTRCETTDGAVAFQNSSIHPQGKISYAIHR